MLIVVSLFFYKWYHNSFWISICIWRGSWINFQEFKVTRSSFVFVTLKYVILWRWFCVMSEHIICPWSGFTAASRCYHSPLETVHVLKVIVLGVVLRSCQWILVGDSVPIRSHQLYVGGSVCAARNCLVLICFRPVQCYISGIFRHNSNDWLADSKPVDYSSPTSAPPVAVGEQVWHHDWWLVARCTRRSLCAVTVSLWRVTLTCHRWRVFRWRDARGVRAV